MKMKRQAVLAAVLLLIPLAFSVASPEKAEAYNNPYQTMKVGLYYGSTALKSANLENYIGSGYIFGYFDSTRTFHTVGGTDKTKLTMLKDWTMYLNGDTYYDEKPSNFTDIIGCYHIKLSNTYNNYEDAAYDSLNFANAFPAYYYGSWNVCVGSYESYEAAQSAMYELGISGEPYTASSYCVTVVSTGTSEILFEFDCGSEASLAVMPKSNTGEKAETWFKGYRYLGAFQYARIDGQNLTVVNVIDIEDYVKGVVPIEMSSSWPIEALKAQAVTARTYAAYEAANGKHKSYGFDICDSVHCQAYVGQNRSTDASDSAVDSTRGKFILYNGELCQTFYHASSGGATEDSENIFYEALPYIRGVVDTHEKTVNTGYDNWSFTYTASQITSILQGKGYSCGNIISITPTYTRMGNMYSLKFTDENGRSLTFSKYDVCGILDSDTYDKHTYSMRFTLTADDNSDASGQGSSEQVYINNSSGPLNDPGTLYAIGSGGKESLSGKGKVTIMTGSGQEEITLASSGIEHSGSTYTINGSGNGHNAGMSQYGANAMAKLGYSYEQIINFYYTGVTIS